MSVAKLTLIGLYNHESTLFDGVVIDPGEDLNRATVIAQILAKCGEFETLYADAVFLKFMISNWWIRWKHTFYKWSRALATEYSPLENYDRKEQIQRNRTGTTSETDSGTIGTITDDTVNRYRSAYDETSNPTLTDRETAAKTQNDTHSNTVHTTGTGQETENNRIHGNIGVTTSQQMLQSELDLYRDFQIYDQIADTFKLELCVFVYS